MIMANRTPYLSATSLALATALVACGGSFRVMNVAPASGELALQGERDEAHADAASYIEQHCPEGHDVLDDGITVVGRQAPTNVTAFGARFGTPAADVVEWRLRYRCVRPAAPAPPPRAPSLAAAPEHAPPPAPPPPEAAPAPSVAPPPPASPPPNNWF